ncbi:hypothetical protein CL634_03755 [bacterium]|nr:hypothetical protein [bacterium]|tara:strand:- start:1037 stop:1423 length:387 start_codon:yes stop_codon:yes gene_type:complete
MVKGNTLTHKKFLSSEIRRSVVRLFKLYLNNLEDIKYLHLIAIDKLKGRLSEKELETLNYLDEEHYNLVRKRTLDNGNEAIRDLSDILDKFEITLIEDRVSQEHIVLKAKTVLGSEERDVEEEAANIQ